MGGETQERVAAEFGISQQRVGQIAARVEAWLATHGGHPLAARMRLRTSRRWDDIWSLAVESFRRSREDREVKKERVEKERVPRPTTSGEARTPNSGETPLPQGPPVATVIETTIRQQNGDPRFLAIAMRVAEREDRRWQQPEPQSRQQAKRRSPAGQSRTLTELEECVAALEADEREPAAQGTHETCPSPLPAPLPAPPQPPYDPDYVFEGVDDLESRELKARGDREGWKRRQEKLKRDLPYMIRREWPDIDDCQPGETTTREKDEDLARLEEILCGTATHPHAKPLPEGEGTTDHRAGTAARKRVASAPRPFFVAFSSRATQYDG
jgi:hypothetical protein